MAPSVSDSPGILVVDDQPDTLTALEALLAPLGHEVVTARSGEEALRRLLDQDFGVIVMDVRMPGMDGFETVELIRQRPRHEDTAIVFLTGADADSEQISRGYSAGAVDYIVKPVDPDVLRSKVAMLLALAEKTAELRESEVRFRAAFEGAPIGIGLSELDGDWIEVNQALCDMVGLSHGELLARPPIEIAHPEDRPGEKEAVARLVQERQGSHQAEVRFTRSDGELRYALVSVSLAVDAHERPLHLIWQVLDMTDRRRAAIESAGARTGRDGGGGALEAAARDRGGARAPRAARHARAARSSACARPSTPISRASCCATPRTRSSSWSEPRAASSRTARPIASTSPGRSPRS